MAGTYDYERFFQSFFDKKGGFADNYFNSTQLLERFRSKQRKEWFVSGQPIYETLEVAGGTAGTYVEMQTFENQRKEIGNRSYSMPVKYYAQLAVSWDDEKRARSKEDMVGTIKKKAANALKTAARTQTTDLCTGTATTGLIGLTTGIYAGAVTNTFCGLSATTYSWWANKYLNVAGNLTIPKLKKIMTLASDGGNEPTVWITDKFIRDFILSNLLQPQERYSGGNDQPAAKLPLVYNKPIVVDAELEDGSDGTDGYLYSIDEDSYHLVVHPEDDWKRWPAVKPDDQFATVTYWSWEGAIVCNNRRRNSVGYGITV